MECIWHIPGALALPQHRQKHSGQLRMLAGLWWIADRCSSWYGKVSRLLATLFCLIDEHVTRLPVKLQASPVNALLVDSGSALDNKQVCEVQQLCCSAGGICSTASCCLCPLDSFRRGFQPSSQAIILLTRRDHCPFAGCPCYAI